MSLNKGHIRVSNTTLKKIASNQIALPKGYTTTPHGYLEKGGSTTNPPPDDYVPTYADSLALYNFSQDYNQGMAAKFGKKYEYDDEGVATRKNTVRKNLSFEELSKDPYVNEMVSHDPMSGDLVNKNRSTPVIDYYNPEDPESTWDKENPNSSMRSAVNYNKSFSDVYGNSPIQPTSFNVYDSRGRGTIHTTKAKKVGDGDWGVIEKTTRAGDWFDRPTSVMAPMYPKPKGTPPSNIDPSKAKEIIQPRSESSLRREEIRNETEKKMQELKEAGLYDGPIRGRGAEDNAAWQEALAKQSTKKVSANRVDTKKNGYITTAKAKADAVTPKETTNMKNLPEGYERVFHSSRSNPSEQYDIYYRDPATGSRKRIATGGADWQPPTKAYGGQHMMPDGSMMAGASHEQPCFECGGSHYMEEGGNMRPYPTNPQEPNMYDKKKLDFQTWLQQTSQTVQLDDQIADGMGIGNYAFADGGNTKWLQKASESMKRKGTKGAFTSFCGGKVTEECIQKGLASDDPKIRKRAQFASNVRKMTTGGNVPEYYHGGPHGSDMNIGRAYMNMADQAVTPDIYGNPEITSAKTSIDNVVYGDKQANINYTTTGVQTQDLTNKGMVMDNNALGQPVGGIQPNDNFQWQPSTNMEVGIPESYNTDPTIGMQIADESQNTFVDSRDSFVSESGTATFDRNKKLERQIKRQDRKDRNRDIDGQTKANIILGGVSWANSVLRGAENNRQDEFYANQLNADNLYGVGSAGESGRRGDYLLNAQASNFRIDEHTFGNRGKGYEEGGEFDMSEEEIAEFIRNGGQLEYLD